MTVGFPEFSKSGADPYELYFDVPLTIQTQGDLQINASIETGDADVTIGDPEYYGEQLLFSEVPITAQTNGKLAIYAVLFADLGPVVDLTLRGEEVVIEEYGFAAASGTLYILQPGDNQTGDSRRQRRRPAYDDRSGCGIRRAGDD